jgi:hypothetical protein
MFPSKLGRLLLQLKNFSNNGFEAGFNLVTRCGNRVINPIPTGSANQIMRVWDFAIVPPQDPL